MQRSLSQPPVPTHRRICARSAPRNPLKIPFDFLKTSG
jgi:hypothetical protein